VTVKEKQIMKKTFALISGILLIAICASAQTPVPADGDEPFIARSVAQGPGDKGADVMYVGKPGPGMAGQVVFLSEADEFGKPVKNAPYTANAVTETTQTLPDGNRIVNKTTTSLARDSEGRTRREESVVRVGSLQANVPKAVMINDPVAHTHYGFQAGTLPGSEGAVGVSTFESKGGKAVFKVEAGDAEGVRIPDGPGEAKGMFRTFGVQKNEIRTFAGKLPPPQSATEAGSAQSADVKHESLGTQVIEGITAEGARDTRTIPAGAIGNEKPIVITSETWRSPELQIVVLSKRNDPRFGETVYKLTDINRSEPDPALFQPPSNLKKELPPLPPPSK
jgi:hypothetical protein